MASLRLSGPERSVHLEEWAEDVIVTVENGDEAASILLSRYEWDTLVAAFNNGQDVIL